MTLSLRRLFPPAYEDEAEDEREYQRLTCEELLTARRLGFATSENELELARAVAVRFARVVGSRTCRLLPGRLPDFPSEAAGGRRQ
jgi:hypothetical protein